MIKARDYILLINPYDMKYHYLLINVKYIHVKYIFNAWNSVFIPLYMCHECVNTDGLTVRTVDR